MKKILFICLCAVITPGHATLTWTQQQVRLDSSKVNQEMDLSARGINSKVTTAPVAAEMVTVCSLTKSTLPTVSAALPIDHAKIEPLALKLIDNASPPGVTESSVKFTVTEAVNQTDITLYCSPLVKLSTGEFINGSDTRIVGEGIELTVHYSSAPQAYLVVSQPVLDLGKCSVGGQLEKSLGLSNYYVGYIAAGKVDGRISWNFTTSGNPDGSVPQVKKDSAVLSATEVSESFTNTSLDSGMSLLFNCNQPGDYKWTMTLQATLN